MTFQEFILKYCESEKGPGSILSDRIFESILVKLSGTLMGRLKEIVAIPWKLICFNWDSSFAPFVFLGVDEVRLNLLTKFLEVGGGRASMVTLKV